MEIKINMFHTRHFAMKWSEVAQSCPTLCDPMDCSLLGSSVHGIFQARVLEWVAISFSKISYTFIKIEVKCGTTNYDSCLRWEEFLSQSTVSVSEVEIYGNDSVPSFHSFAITPKPCLLGRKQWNWNSLTLNQFGGFL